MKLSQLKIAQLRSKNKQTLVGGFEIRKQTNVKSNNWKEAKKLGIHFVSSQCGTRFTLRNSCPA